MKQMELMMSSKIEGSVKAAYRSTNVPSYKGNPLIECLPNLGTATEVIQRLNCFPTTVLRSAPARVRASELVSALSAIFVGFPQHHDLAVFIDNKIKQGYVPRNPNLKLNPKLLQANYEKMLNGDMTLRLEPSKVFDTPMSGSVYGVAGLGKTTSLKRLLSHYPQVLHHEKWNITQITSLYINFPHDGSSKRLCINFFNALNKAIKKPNTVWFERRESPATMLEKMQAAVVRFNIGILVIDEFQMWRVKSGESEKVVNFLVSLINTIKLPIIFTGTPAAIGKLESEVTGARRIAGFNDWDPLKIKFGSNQNKEDKPLWDYFARKLWSYQYLSKPAAAFTAEINEAWFDCCQGILDIAIKLFIQVQLRAIHSKKEEITVELIRRVYDDDFKSMHSIIHALRSNNPDLISHYSDLPQSKIAVKIATLSKSIAKSTQESTQLPLNPLGHELLDLLIQIGYEKDTAKAAVDAVISENVELDKKSLLPLAIDLLNNNAEIKPTLVSKCKKTTKKNKPLPPDFKNNSQGGLFDDLI
ncbi:ATP-binding protein [Paraglaciecola aquimarina]|uniref:ATP-binding protein n=1 Tax=Paraglaciecola aquimarina TaxID=1235557 RepID=A0ABU3SUS2_9ALTE|nr:ATP-binding protein [Paraglaciecola aquimarina]MDU0353758.1 ATP-binding protein [Paraglaciecola aquimarina]